MRRTRRLGSRDLRDQRRLFAGRQEGRGDGVAGEPGDLPRPQAERVGDRQVFAVEGGAEHRWIVGVQGHGHPVLQQAPHRMVRCKKPLFSEHCRLYYIKLRSKQVDNQKMRD